MAVQDIRSNLKQSLGIYGAIASNTTTVGAIFDTADYELGLMFGMAATAYTDGTYDLLIEESDDAGMAGATTVMGDQLIGSLPSVTAAVSNGDDLATVGVISNKRYIRVSVVSTGTTTGATLLVIATQKAEVMPEVV